MTFNSTTNATYYFQLGTVNDSSINESAFNYDNFHVPLETIVAPSNELVAAWPWFLFCGVASVIGHVLLLLPLCGNIASAIRSQIAMVAVSGTLLASGLIFQGVVNRAVKSHNTTNSSLGIRH